MASPSLEDRIFSLTGILQGCIDQIDVECMRVIAQEESLLTFSELDTSVMESQYRFSVLIARSTAIDISQHSKGAGNDSNYLGLTYREK
ncbi:hypothetical protein RRG08_015412 [Elysia crispata]|uniref:Uncharacterized protein n=1 Tax=Elysia crispata TaxID=231223 RepID=A0AAE0Z1Y7_9GAST|nr:hypothetical protein RRG08_015412 [Elysia crispata]